MLFPVHSRNAPHVSNSTRVHGAGSWAVTYGEKQCSCEHHRECQGCHNRKRGDITRPSGGTEADGAGMRLNYPCGIWLRHQGLLSSFPRQREEAIRLACAICILFIKMGIQGSRKWHGLGKRGISVHSPAPWPSPRAQRGRANLRLSSKHILQLTASHHRFLTAEGLVCAFKFAHTSP